MSPVLLVSCLALESTVVVLVQMSWFLQIRPHGPNMTGTVAETVHLGRADEYRKTLSSERLWVLIPVRFQLHQDFGIKGRRVV